MIRIRSLLLIVAALSVLLAACGSADVEGGATTEATDAPSAPTSEQPSTAGSTAQSNEPAGTATTEFIPDYAALIAAVEAGMEGTAYEGAALEDPEVFMVTAELFCDLLDEGMSTDDLLAEYLDRLSDGGAVEVDEEDGLMAGVLLGASIEIVCPEYATDGM